MVVLLLLVALDLLLALDAEDPVLQLNVDVLGFDARNIDRHFDRRVGLGNIDLQRLRSLAEFTECWTASAATPPERVSDPFVQLLSHRGGLAVDKSLQAICSHGRTPFINLDRYDVDVELAKTFPREVCRRLCVLPMDKMSKAVFVATANPFNKRAEEELRQFTAYRIVWYLAMPNDLHRLIEKIYR